MMLNILADVAMLAVTGSFVAFVILYHLLANWRASRMGRYVMTFMTLCSVIMLYVAFSAAFGPIPEPARVWVRLLLYGALAATGWWQVGLLISEQSKARKRDTLGKHHSKR